MDGRTHVYQKKPALWRLISQKLGIVSRWFPLEMIFIIVNIFCTWPNGLNQNQCFCESVEKKYQLFPFLGHFFANASITRFSPDMGIM